MKHFLLGLLVAIPGLVGGGYLFLRLGFLDPRANRRPSKFETALAMRFLDASVGRRSPQRRNPLPADRQNLTVGLKVYEAHCAVCHGDLSHPRSVVGLGLYPPAPQFFDNAPDMPESENFYIIRNGIRWTGMPSWNQVLSEEQIWKLTSFLAHIQHLPPAVAQEWKRPVPAKTRATAVKEQGANRHE
ncbi:MAG TPA: cytochrome c [Candidatus Dormibacteraeota bacterium]|nr:cytochrome c [Candidatus Dormibacteraeota bacterium]